MPTRATRLNPGGSSAPLVPPPISGWTPWNSGSASQSGYDRVLAVAAAGASDNWKGEYRTLSPASSYTAAFYIDFEMPVSTNNYAAIILRNSGSGSFVTFGPYFANSTWNLLSYRWTSVTSSNTQYAIVPVAQLTIGIPNWLRFRDDGTTRFFEYSYNGVDWLPHTSIGRTDFIIPDQIGWAIDANGTGFTDQLRLRSFAGVA
jgi:hypothetical protein